MKYFKWLTELETYKMFSSCSQRLLKIDLPILKSQSQYLVCPPCALITAVHLLLMEPMTCAWKSCGMSFYTWMRSLPSCCRFVGCWGRWRNRRSISSQTCSIGFRSGEFAGHGSTSTLFSFKTNMTDDSCCMWAGIIMLKCNAWSVLKQKRNHYRFDWSSLDTSLQ